MTMLRFVQTKRKNVHDAAEAVIEQIMMSKFPGVESIEVIDFFVMEGARIAERTSFEVYCVAEVIRSYGDDTPLRMAVIANAEKWPTVINYTLLGENQAPLSADAPPHILAQLDPPLMVAGKQWRQRCAQGPRWTYAMDIERISGGFKISVVAEREFKTHLVFELSPILVADLEEIIAGIKHDYPGLVLPVHMQKAKITRRAARAI